MLKKRLLTPGPTPVPEETLLELAKPVFFHRSSEFRQVLAEVLEGMKYVYCTKNTVVPLTCSGSGGLEAAVVNCIPAGKKAICLIAGKFGERWRNICKAYGIESINVTAPLGQPVRPEQVEQALQAHPDAVAVCSTLSETSTGIGHDIEAFGRVVSATNTLLLVDAISGLAAMECRVDDWKIDVCVTGSQKALMMPPGLAFLSVGERAWKAIDANTGAKTFYFDLKKARASLDKGDTPYTPAHTLIKAMQVSLKKIRDYGIEKMWAYQARNAQAAQAAFRALGLELFAERPANGLTTVKMPDGMDSTALLSLIEKKYGLKLANGQDPLKGKIFRLAHMGYIDQFDVLAGIAGVELGLAEMGFPVEPGVGITAAQQVYASSEV